ncbi:MAG: PleD family two-component system response regulator [Granulosicoccus sp.]
MKGSDNLINVVSPTNSLGDITVLLVDDSKTIRRSASNFLSTAGYNVVTAVDGFEALAKVVEYKPAIIFADIMMPRLDGYQTCALIKNNADYRDIPVVMLSSKDGLFDKARARVVGSDAHVSKPFTAETLTAAVTHHLGQTAKGSVKSSTVAVVHETSDA